VGDYLAMEGTHELAAGMCGVKTAGDLVMRMEFQKGMRIHDAKKYVAEKLGIPVYDLHDCAVMEDVRERLGLGGVKPLTGKPSGIECKHHVAQALGIDIISVTKNRRLSGIEFLNA
jgi:dimethylamine--corrinoid protein Co-methyltransferase